MAQLHYDDMEARRQLADVDHDDRIHIQGEGYGVMQSDDQKRSSNSPPPRSSEAPLEVHHQRHNPFSGSDSSSPLAVPSSYGTRPVTSGCGKQDLKPAEAAKALPGAGAHQSSIDQSGISEESMAKELQNHSAAGRGIIDVHNLKDNYIDLSEENIKAPELGEDNLTTAATNDEETAELTSQIKSPVDEPKQEQASQIDPPIVNYSEQEQAAQPGPMSEHSKPLPQSDATEPEQQREAQSDDDLKQEHRQPCPDRIHIQGEGYGVMQSDDQKRSSNSPPPRSSEAPLEVHQHHNPFSGSDSSSPLVVPSSYGTRPVTSGYGNLDLKPEEAAKALPGAGAHESSIDQSGRISEESMAKELQAHSAAGRGIIDVHNLKDNYIDLSEENIKAPELGGDNLTSAATNHEETAQLTSQIKSPVDEPKQEQASQIDSPIVTYSEQEQAAQPDPVSEHSKPLPQSDAAEQEQQREVQPDEDLKQEHRQPCPDGDDSHVCQAFEGKYGREKLNVEGFNTYSGEPENAVYDAADVRSGEPESEVGVRDRQEILGIGKQEDEASVKDEKDHLQDGKTPKNLVEDASYVMGGRPESGIVVKEDDGREMQEVEQEKSLPTKNADMHDMGEDADVNQVSKPLPKAEDEDVHELQGGGADVALQTEDKTSIADILSDDQSGMRQLRNPDQPLDIDEGVDVEDITQDKRESPNEVGMEDQRKESGKSEEGADVALQTDDKTSIADIKSDDQSGMRQVRNPDQPLDIDEGVDVEDTTQDKRESLNEVGMEDQRKESGKSEEGADVALQTEDKTSIADIKSDDESGMRQVRNPDQPLDIDEGVDVEDTTQDKRESPNEVGMEDQRKESGKSEEGADVALQTEDKTSIADIKSDDQSGMRQVRYPDQPLDIDEGVDVEDTTQDKRELPNEVGMEDQRKESGKREEGADVSLQTEDKTSIADILSDDQSGLRQVPTPDQPLNIDEGVDVEEKTQDKRDSFNEVGMEDQKKESGKSRGIAFLDEEQKDMAKGGERFVLNSLVVDYNAESLPVEQEAELRVDSSQDTRDPSPSAENATVESLSPYTEFDHTDEYVKAGYGSEGFVPQKNEEVDRKLREPVDQEEDRRQTQEHPLDKSLQLDAQGSTDEYALDMGANAPATHRPGISDIGKFDGGKVSEYDDNVPVKASIEGHESRPPTLPHPQPDDLTGYLKGKSNNDIKDLDTKEPEPADHHEGQHPEGAPHKKGVFEKIKEKLTPHAHNGST
ncbi:hypothetical protein GOP47_0027029 [Adiantum capillus-veneris]|nr:hypothetical protein GOP47_0027029 [Adiantum capillus-veneris]